MQLNIYKNLILNVVHAVKNDIIEILKPQCKIKIRNNIFLFVSQTLQLLNNAEWVTLE